MIKRSILVLSILSLSPFHAQAQDGIRFGFGGGINRGRLSFPPSAYPADSSLSQSPDNGLMLFMFLQSRISDFAYFVPQLTFIQRSARIENVSYYISTNYQYFFVPKGTIQLDAEYLDFSAKFMSKFGFESFKICPAVGPYVGLNLSSHSTYSVPSGMSQSNTVSREHDQITTPFELGIDLGIQIELLPLESVSYILTYNYSIALTDYGGISGIPPGNMTLMGNQLTLSVSFAL